MNKIARDQNTRNSLIDLLHSISKRVNKITRNIENNLSVNTEELNKIRALTTEVEHLEKTNLFK